MEILPMKKSMSIMLVVSAILIAGVFLAGCTQEETTAATTSISDQGQAAVIPAETNAHPSDTPAADMQVDSTAPSGTPPAGMEKNMTRPSGNPPTGMEMNMTHPSGTPPADMQNGGTPPSGSPPSGTPPSGSPASQ
jgi:hypothetical protein